jgi:hypothetical protein
MSGNIAGGRIYLMNKDTLKTFVQGALGAMTFGMYHQYTTNRIMEINNKSFNDKIEDQREELKNQREEHEKQRLEYERKLQELSDKINKKSRWW